MPAQPNRKIAPDQQDIPGRALLEAIEAGDLHRADELLDQGLDVNGPMNFSGQLALPTAAGRGNIAMAQLLIDRGALADGKPDDLGTPLTSAGYHGDTAMIRFLVDHGANVNKCAKDGWTPLCSASSSGSVEAVRLLLECGADPNGLSRGGTTALITAAEKGSVDIMQLLLDAGADIDARQGRNWTALAVAAEDDQLGAVRLLLDNGADRSLVTVDGRTALSCAVFKATAQSDPYFANCHPTPARNEIVNLLRHHPGGTRKPPAGIKPAKNLPEGPGKLFVPKPLKPLKPLPSKKGPPRP